MSVFLSMTAPSTLSVILKMLGVTTITASTPFIIKGLSDFAVKTVNDLNGDDENEDDENNWWK